MVEEGALFFGQQLGVGIQQQADAIAFGSRNGL